MLMSPFWREGIPAAPAIIVRPPNPFYVNTVTGTSGGSGTLESPSNSLLLARAATAGIPDSVISIVAPEQNPILTEFVYESDSDLYLKGTGDEPWHASGADPLVGEWTGSGPVYQRVLDYTLCRQVIVTSLSEVILGHSFHIKLNPNDVTPTNPSAGQFGYAGGILYVRLPDSSNANLHTFEVARRNTCLTTIGFGKLDIENAVVRYFLTNGIANGRSTQPVGTGVLHVRDSLIEYGFNGGIGAAGMNEETIATRVKAYRVDNDGFNHHATGGRQYMELQDCDGSYNGSVAGQSAQGASNHETTHMVIKGGRYVGNVSGGMVVINSAKCDIIGDSEFGPVMIRDNMRLGNTVGVISTQGACAWLDTSTGNVSGQVDVIDNQGVGVRIAAGATVTGRNNINSAGNALPDIG